MSADVCKRCKGAGKFPRCENIFCPAPQHCACNVYDYICECPAGDAARRAEREARAHAPSASPAETESANGRAALQAWRSR